MCTLSAQVALAESERKLDDSSYSSQGAPSYTNESNDPSFRGEPGRDERRLPIGRHQPPVHTTKPTSPGQSGKFAAGPTMIRLLVVEDDEFQQHAILELCKQCGYTNARTASDATEALEMVREVRADRS